MGMHLNALLSLKGKLTLKDTMFIASPMLKTLSQIENKLNLLPMMPFLVYMHGRHLENFLSENNITS